MNFEEIINMWGVNIKNDIDLFETFSLRNPRHCYYIDRFPLRIKSFEKYEQEELYYQEVIDKKIDKDIFKKEEAKFINIIRKLWLYNQLYVQTNISEVSENSFSKTIEGNDTNLNYRSLKSTLINSKVIKKVNYLDLLMKLSLRECVYSKLLFFEQEILLIAYGMCFQVYFHNLSTLEFVKKVVCTEGLYLRPYIEE